MEAGDAHSTNVKTKMMADAKMQEAAVRILLLSTLRYMLGFIKHDSMKNIIFVLLSLRLINSFACII